MLQCASRRVACCCIDYMGNLHHTWYPFPLGMPKFPTRLHSCEHFICSSEFHPIFSCWWHVCSVEYEDSGLVLFSGVILKVIYHHVTHTDEVAGLQ